MIYNVLRRMFKYVNVNFFKCDLHIHFDAIPLCEKTLCRNPAKMYKQLKQLSLPNILLKEMPVISLAQSNTTADPQSLAKKVSKVLKLLR